MEDKTNTNYTGSEPVEFNYSKSIYNGDTKTIIIAYYLCGEAGNSYKVKNFQEKISDTAIGLGGTSPYHIVTHTIYLPKAYCKILKTVDGMPEFYYIEIPYWIYKKNIETMAINRWDGKHKRGQFFVPAPSRNEDYYNTLRDVENQTAFATIGVNVENYSRYIQQK